LTKKNLFVTKRLVKSQLQLEPTLSSLITSSLAPIYYLLAIYGFQKYLLPQLFLSLDVALTPFTAFIPISVNWCPTLDLEDVAIGGKDIIVEMDESKLGKRKYHRGHAVEGVWILEGIERTVERKVFIAKIEDKTENTLMDVIRKHVKTGSIIYTDMWKGYASLSTDGSFQHLTVNHSPNFKDPVSGVHTNTIEDTWNGIKQMTRPRNRVEEGIEEHLWEFI
jgi:transposase-like protein